jgi:hypothetical protein
LSSRISAGVAALASELYALLGVAKGDKDAVRRQHARNFASLTRRSGSSSPPIGG